MIFFICKKYQTRSPNETENITKYADVRDHPISSWNYNDADVTEYFVVRLILNSIASYDFSIESA